MAVCFFVLSKQFLDVTKQTGNGREKFKKIEIKKGLGIISSQGRLKREGGNTK